MSNSIDFHRACRVLAHLIRNEGVDAEAIERAVVSALDMRLGEESTLTGGDHPAMRRAFVMDQVIRLSRK